MNTYLVRFEKTEQETSWFVAESAKEAAIKFIQGSS